MAYIHILQPIVIVALTTNEIAAQHSNTWLEFVVAVAVQEPSTFPSSTCISFVFIKIIN